MRSPIYPRIRACYIENDSAVYFDASCLKPIARRGGIYTIQNLDSGRVYIGDTWSLGKRYATHNRLLHTQKHDIPEMQQDFNVYGADSFEFTVHKFITGSEGANYASMERCLIASLAGRVRLYNRLIMPRWRVAGVNPVLSYNPLRFDFDSLERSTLSNAVNNWEGKP